jgi:hypothetical protein
VTPRSTAAFTSMEALRIPEVTRRRSRGRRSSSARGKGVRSRIAITTSKSASRFASASGASRWSEKT